MSRPPSLSPREARDRFLDKRKVDRREQSISTYKYRLKLFVEWCEENGIESIDELTGWDLESYETHRRSQDLSPLTLNKELGTVKNFLEYCARIEIVPEDLPEKMEPPEVPDDAQSSDVKLAETDALALLRHYRSKPGLFGTRAHVLLELTWATGARVGGIRAIDIRDYKSEKSYVYFRHRPETDTPLKNGRDGERVVGLPEDVVEALGRYLDEYRYDVHDDFGRQPLLASRNGRPAPGTIRDWMYNATLPCIHGPCPHDRDPSTCKYTEYHHASKCPSSRSPHQVRTGSVTWQLNRGVPLEVVSNRVNSSAEVIEQHYDKETAIEEFEQRRRSFLDRLNIDSDSEIDQ